LLQSKKSQQLRYSVASRLLKTLASWLPGSATAPRRAPRSTRRRRSTKARRSEGSSSINEITTASLLRGFAAFQNSRVLATRLLDGPPPRTTKNTKTTPHEGAKRRSSF